MTTTPTPAGTRLDPERIALRPDEAAYLIGVSRSRLYELMGAGRIRSVKLDGRSRRIPRQALIDYIDSLSSDNGAA